MNFFSKIIFFLLKSLLHPILKIPFFFNLQQKMNNYEVVKIEFSKYLKIKEKKILEIGCSTGSASLQIIDSKNNIFYGIDIDPGYVRLAQKKNANGNFFCMDAQSLDFEDNYFDRILICAVLHHLDDKIAKKILQEASRVVKKDGFILNCEPTFTRNLISTFLLKLDRGEYIRTHSQYKKLFGKIKIVRERGFLFTRHRYSSFCLQKISQ